MSWSMGVGEIWNPLYDAAVPHPAVINDSGRYLAYVGISPQHHALAVFGYRRPEFDATKNHLVGALKLANGDRVTARWRIHFVLHHGTPADQIAEVKSDTVDALLTFPLWPVIPRDPALSKLPVTSIEIEEWITFQEWLKANSPRAGGT